MAMKSKGKTTGKQKKRETPPRHRNHSMDKHYYSIWLDLELMAKRRVFSKKVSSPISKILIELIEKLIQANNVKLTPEAKAWMENRRRINANRKA